MPFDSANADLQVIPVKTPDELKRFIALPARLNAKDPNWITPLTLERIEALTPKTNPFFAHAEASCSWPRAAAATSAGSAPRSTSSPRSPSPVAWTAISA